MYASAASRCACNELKFCSSPSSVDLRVYIAQRRTPPASLMHLSLLQPEEQKSVPTRACHLVRNRAQRAVGLVLENETVLRYSHHDQPPLIGSLEFTAHGR